VHVKTLRSQKLRMLLTHRKLLQSKAIAIDNDLRGTLRTKRTCRGGLTMSVPRVKQTSSNRPPMSSFDRAAKLAAIPAGASPANRRRSSHCCSYIQQKRSFSGILPNLPTQSVRNVCDSLNERLRDSLAARKSLNWDQRVVGAT
jgi:hypothetical protein